MRNNPMIKYVDLRIIPDEAFDWEVCNSCKVLEERKIRITFAPRNKKAS